MILCQLRHRQYAAGDAQATQQRLDVGAVAQECIVDQRGCVGIVAGDGNAAAALGLQQDRVDAEAVATRKGLARLRAVGGHQHELHVGALEAFGGAQEAGDFKQVAGDLTFAGEQVLQQAPEIARQHAGRDAVRLSVLCCHLHHGRWVVVQVLPHAGTMQFYVYAKPMQPGGIADAAVLQDGGRAVSAGTQQHFAPGMQGFAHSAAFQRNAGGAAFGNLDAVHKAVGEDVQVLPVANRIQKCGNAGYAAAVVDGVLAYVETNRITYAVEVGAAAVA